MKKHLIFSDLDGTLAGPDHNVNEQTKKAIRKILDDGHDFYIATGRMMSLVAGVASSIDPRVKIIASNGGVIQNKNHYIKAPMDKKTIVEVYNVLLKHDIPALLFTDIDILYTHMIPEFFGSINDFHLLNNLIPTFKKINNIEEDIKDFNIINILATIRLDVDKDYEDNPKDLERLEAAREEIKTIPGINVTSSSSNNIEIYPLTTSKGNAVKKVIKELDANHENVICFGDGYNDVSMFEVVKTSVAMENAPQGVKDLAQFTTIPNYENGVAHFLMNYFK